MSTASVLFIMSFLRKGSSFSTRSLLPRSSWSSLTSRSIVLLHSTAAKETEQAKLLHPNEIGDGYIPYPKALSPSAINEFKKCPQSFLFQYLFNLKQPTSLALAKGSMCHSALEKIFDLDPPDRTLPVLQDLYRAEWQQHRMSDTYRILFEKSANDDTVELDSTGTKWDINSEKEWGQSALQLLENYYQLEDPRQVIRPNPVKREIWLNSHLTVDPTLGATANNNNSDQLPTSKDDSIPTFHVRGIVDRLDMVRTKDQASNVALRIVDYKTGTNHRACTIALFFVV